MSRSAGVDPYLDPGSGALRNRLDITDPGELAQVEAALYAGHHIDWVRMDPDRNNAASAAAHRGDLGPMTAMLCDLVDLPHPPGPAGPGDGRIA